MKVYAVLNWIAYEGATLSAIFSTKELAEAWTEKQNRKIDPRISDYEHFVVEEYTLDEEPEE